MYAPGERVQLRFPENTEAPTARDPSAVRLVFQGRNYALGAGLELQRDGGLTVVLQLPREYGWYGYEFYDGDEIVGSGTLRVTDAAPARRGTTVEAQRSSASLSSRSA